ncbi:MAG: SAM-dependent DNA methyltransferase [Candidatus Omnitrophica bacterium]|nr:SAM-dependent DNA methyltransferase [Candidatus Omnitrophota bacterium]
MTKQLIKSKSRIRNHGEVFTPDFIVEDMLDLVKSETERIDSRFLEPACGEGNFLIKILERKLDVVDKRYKKNQFDYERNSLIAISSIYGIELLDDNVLKARGRLYDYFLKRYTELYKDKINNLFLENIKFILEKNIIQGDALTFKDKDGKAIIFSEWSAVNGTLIKRRDFQFRNLANFDSKQLTFNTIIEKSDDGRTVWLPKPIREYPAVNFLKLKEQEESVK